MSLKFAISVFTVAFILGTSTTETPSPSNPAPPLEQPILAEVPKRISNHLTETRGIVKKYTHDHETVLVEFDCFADTLKSVFEAGEGLIEKDIHRIIDAISFASEKHKHQSRRDVEKTPYIIHPIIMANTLMVIGRVRDADIIIAALLHDTVEDTAATFEEIMEQFGARVEGIVREVTDDKSMQQEERRRSQVHRAPHMSCGAAQVQLVDKLYNLEDVMRNPPPEWNKEKRDTYFEWGQEVVENLPWVNAPLKEAIDDLAIEYWQEESCN